MAFICIKKDELGYSYIPEKRVLHVQYDDRHRVTTVTYLDEHADVEGDVFFAHVFGEPKFIGAGE